MLIQLGGPISIYYLRFMFLDGGALIKYYFFKWDSF